MFSGTDLFNGDISKWDVSSTKTMARMFCDAKLFDGDISKWDVSSVKNMYGMFYHAVAFNGDISKWDVSSVTDMNYMFLGAKSLKQKLCLDAWVSSKARKIKMFEGSSGSISSTKCTATAFSPRLREELQSAVNGCLKLSPQCSHGPHGPIVEWDVSHV